MLEAFSRQLSIDYLIRKKYVLVLHRVLVLLVLEFNPHEENIEQLHPAKTVYIKENPVKTNALPLWRALFCRQIGHLRGHLLSQARNGDGVAHIPVKFSDITSF
jgi:hypothetical protein